LRENSVDGPVEDGHGVTVLGTDGKVLHADRATCETLGLTEAALVGCRLGDLVPLHDAGGEHRHVRPDGSVVWLLVDAEPSVGGEVRVHIQDVTGARAAAEAERAASMRFRIAVEGSWVLDADGCTAAISASAARMLGREPEEMRGRPPLDFVDERDRGVLLSALERRRFGIREPYEVRWRHADGTSVWAQMSAAPMLDGEGRTIGSFALVTDVNDRRAVDERLDRQGRQQDAIMRLGGLALEGLDRDRLLDEAVRVTSDVLDAELAGVFRLTPEQTLVLVAAHGLPTGVSRDLELDLAGTALSAEALAAGDPVVIADWAAEEALCLPPLAAQLGVRSTTAIPVRGRRVHGVLGVAQRVPWTPYPDEVRYLQSVANILAAAQDRMDAESEGRTRALHDPLTGLPNRTLVLDRVDQALKRDDAGSLAVLAVDIDRFKKVNDSFGAAAGDEVVCRVAARLRGLVGPADTVARLAGDAFVLVCDDLADDDSGALASRVLEALREPVQIAGEDLLLTASVGVAVATSSDRATSAADLLRDADAALARAKSQGRDRVEHFDPASRARAVERALLERDLRRAIDRGELYVDHQPIVSVSGGQVIGTEALVRWRHPERGVVPPGDFIGVAEETGLIDEIGAWVLQTACADVATRHRNGRPLTCHVNLSPRQAADPELPAFVAGVLEASGLAPELLVLELTESSVMEAGEQPLCVMQGIRELGVRLVLDDFGTGYSSLSRLRHFQIDGLKIDRSFIADLDGDDPADALIVAGVVELARALGLTVVAEGVETEAQLRRLDRIGCRYAQGFLLARPGGLDELDRLLQLDSLLPVTAA
jgi:diguanylate cyclase (GGDEF)-like protein/PAS domain S-box-containing protein